MEGITNRSIHKQTVQAVALFFSAILLFVLIQLFPIPASDWGFIRDAARRPWAPFEIAGYFNPPWVAGFFIPLGMISYSWSLAINRSAILVTTLLLVRKSGGGPGAMLLAMTSAPFAILFTNANIDWLPMLALLLPYEAGLPFLMSKPQSMHGLLLVWWQQSTWERRGRLIMIAVMLLLISWRVWGMWPLEWMKATASIRGGIFWNLASWFWPRGIWLGLVLLWAAWKTQEELYALTASIFLTPYLAFYSFTPLVVVLIGRNRVMGGLVWISMWTLHLVVRREVLAL